MPKKSLLYLLLLLVGTATFFQCKSKKDRGANYLLKVCPDEWYLNRMPGASDSSLPNEYFVIDGKRRELKEFDLEWIRKNCAIKGPEIVY